LINLINFNSIEKTFNFLAIGMGLCTSSFSLALNTYFKENRNKAFGIGATITGLGNFIFLDYLNIFKQTILFISLKNNNISQIK
jgi:hypothetical protein